MDFHILTFCVYSTYAYIKNNNNNKKHKQMSVGSDNANLFYLLDL